jgi:hypothetical protein
MLFTPRHIVLLARGLLVVGILGAGVLIFDPTNALAQVDEAGVSVLGATAFYVLGATAFIANPHRRRKDVAVMLIVVALMLEVARALCGRSGRPLAATAEVVGVLALMAPAWVEWLRLAARTYTHVPFGSFSLREERRGRRQDWSQPWAAQNTTAPPALPASSETHGVGQHRYS